MAATGSSARPGWAIWTAWALALVGGLAVVAAAIVALTDPCAEGGLTAATAESCAQGVPLGLVQTLTLGGTALAIVGGVAATALTVRRLTGGSAPRQVEDLA